MKILLMILSFVLMAIPALAEDKLTQCKPDEMKFYVSAQLFYKDHMSTFGSVICSRPGDNESEEGIYRILHTVIAMNGDGKNPHVALQNVWPLKH